MNRLIAYLRKENELSIEALRGLYRSLALKCHPDVTGKTGTEFVQLQLEYEDALRQLLVNQGGYKKRLSEARRASGDPRSTFLRTLYLYSIVYDRPHWKDIFPALVQSGKEYNRFVGQMLDQYGRIFVDKSNRWKNDSRMAEAHEKLLSAIKQLGSYYENDVYPNKRLLLSYIEEVIERAKHLDLEAGGCVRKFGEYLKQELKGPRVPFMMTWDRKQGSA
jgi:hypothetical protein